MFFYWTYQWSASCARSEILCWKHEWWTQCMEMSSWKRWLVYSSGASASFWGFRGWCSASLDAAVRAGIITILAQVTIINVIHQCQTDYHKFTMTKLTKKSRYFNINQKFDIDRNGQTFGFLSQSISCRAAPPSPRKKVETINKTIALPCKSILHIITATNPTFWNVSQMKRFNSSKASPTYLA